MTIHELAAKRAAACAEALNVRTRALANSLGVGLDGDSDQMAWARYNAACERAAAEYAAGVAALEKREPTAELQLTEAPRPAAARSPKTKKLMVKRPVPALNHVYVAVDIIHAVVESLDKKGAPFLVAAYQTRKGALRLLWLKPGPFERGKSLSTNTIDREALELIPVELFAEKIVKAVFARQRELAEKAK